MKEYVAFITRMIKETIMLMLLVGGLLFVLAPLNWVYGWLWGCMGEVVYLSILRVLSSHVFIEEAYLHKFISRMIWGRMLMIGICLYVAVLSPYFQILATLAGLLSFKFLIFIDHFFVKPYLSSDET